MCKSWIVVVAMALTGCMPSTQAVNVTRILVDRPELNQSADVEIGENLIERGVLAPREALLLINPVTWEVADFTNLGATSYAILPGVLIGFQRDEDYTYFDADSMFSETFLQGPRQRWGGICISNSDPSDIRAYLRYGSCNVTLDPAPSLERTEVLFGIDGGHAQMLTYLGRRGDILRFRYFELFVDSTRQRLVYNFEHDLGATTIMALKGARIEIERADDFSLSYRLTAPFSPDTEEKPIGDLLEIDSGEIVTEISHTIPREVLVLSEQYAHDTLTNQIILPAGVLPKVDETRGATFYHSINMMVEMITRSQPALGGLCVTKDEPSDVNLWFNGTLFCTGINSPSNLPPIELTTRPAFDLDGYRQELVYVGRLGNEVRFLYRENFADIEKPPSILDIVHNLDDGNILEIQSARIEIVNANATGLQYRILTPISAN